MKTLRIFVLCFAVMTMAQSTQAQGLGGLLKQAGKAVNKVAGNGAASDVVSGVLGTLGIQTGSLKGTWSYTSPCLVFESDNALSSMGSNLVCNKVNTLLGSALTKGGVKPGGMLMKFEDDSHCSISVAGHTVPATYTVDGPILTLNVAKVSVPMNVKITGNKAQLGMKTDKLLALIQAVSLQGDESVAGLGSISNLQKNFNGMQVGLQMEKK